MKAKCIKGFALEKCDDDGFTIENEYFVVDDDSIWNIEEDEYRFIGGETRLTNDKGEWLEVSKETFEEHFEKARKEYTKRGWNYIECTLCGAKFNAGRASNGAGQRYVNAGKEEWWAKHTGVPQDRYANTLDKEEYPELCPCIKK